MCSHEFVWVEEKSKQKVMVSEASSVFITINTSLGPTLSQGFSSTETHTGFISAARVTITQTAWCVIRTFINLTKRPQSASDMKIWHANFCDLRWSQFTALLTKRKGLLCLCDWPSTSVGRWVLQWEDDLVATPLIHLSLISMWLSCLPMFTFKGPAHPFVVTSNQNGSCDHTTRLSLIPHSNGG